MNHLRCAFGVSFGELLDSYCTENESSMQPKLRPSKLWNLHNLQTLEELLKEGALRAQVISADCLD